jgi:hypothetical protein
MCVECGNAANGGGFRPVRWPADVDQIGAALDRRPVHRRNMTAGQSLPEILAENTHLHHGGRP